MRIRSDARQVAQIDVLKCFFVCKKGLKNLKKINNNNKTDMLVSVLCGPSPTDCTAKKLSSILEVFGEHKLCTSKDILDRLLGPAETAPTDNDDSLMMKSLNLARILQSFLSDENAVRLKLTEIESEAGASEGTLQLAHAITDSAAGFALVYFEYEADGEDFLDHIFTPEKGTRSSISSVLTVGEAMETPEWLPAKNDIGRRIHHQDMCHDKNGIELPLRFVQYEVLVSCKQQELSMTATSIARCEHSSRETSVQSNMSDGSAGGEMQNEEMESKQTKRFREETHRNESINALQNNQLSEEDRQGSISCSPTRNNHEYGPLTNAIDSELIPNELIVSLKEAWWAVPLIQWAMERWKQAAIQFVTSRTDLVGEYFSYCVTSVALPPENNQKKKRDKQINDNTSCPSSLPNPPHILSSAVSIVFAQPLAALLMYEMILQRIRVVGTGHEPRGIRVAFSSCSVSNIFPNDCKVVPTSSHTLNSFLSSLRSRSPTPPRVVLEGTKVDRYRLTKRLGKGNNAVVLLGEHAHAQREVNEPSQVAVKILFEHSRHATAEVATLQKAQQSAHTPRIFAYHVIEVQGRDKLVKKGRKLQRDRKHEEAIAPKPIKVKAVVMELLGCDLFDLAHARDYAFDSSSINSGSESIQVPSGLSTAECLALIISAIQALKEFHSATGMVHGSVKLENFCTERIVGSQCTSSHGNQKVNEGLAFAKNLLNASLLSFNSMQDANVEAPRIKLLDYGRARPEDSFVDEEPFTGWWYSDRSMIGLPLTAVDDLLSLLHASTYLLLAADEVQLQTDPVKMSECDLDEDTEPFRQFVYCRKMRMNAFNDLRRGLLSAQKRGLNAVILKTWSSLGNAFEEKVLSFTAKKDIPRQVQLLDNIYSQANSILLLPRCTPTWWRELYEKVYSIAACDDTHLGIGSPMYNQIISLMEEAIKLQLHNCLPAA